MGRVNNLWPALPVARIVLFSATAPGRHRTPAGHRQPEAKKKGREKEKKRGKKKTKKKRRKSGAQKSRQRGTWTTPKKKPERPKDETKDETAKKKERKKEEKKKRDKSGAESDATALACVAEVTPIRTAAARNWHGRLLLRLGAHTRRNRSAVAHSLTPRPHHALTAHFATSHSTRPNNKDAHPHPHHPTTPHRTDDSIKINVDGDQRPKQNKTQQTRPLEEEVVDGGAVKTQKRKEMSRRGGRSIKSSRPSLHRRGVVSWSEQIRNEEQTLKKKNNAKAKGKILEQSLVEHTRKSEPFLADAARETKKKEETYFK